MEDFSIDVEILDEAGFNAAMVGVSLSHNQDPKKMPNVAQRLAPKDLGHNKFLESMMVWLMVRAPRYWWQQADTYRISTKQSESTMHTIMKRPLLPYDFEVGGATRGQITALNKLIKDNDFSTLKKRIPESIMQKRVWCMSYKTLRNMIIQRAHHKLPHWKSFAEQALRLVQYPQFLPSLGPPGTENAIPKQHGDHVARGTSVHINHETWKVHRFIGSDALLVNPTSNSGRLNIIMSENDVLQSDLFNK